ncbi:MAG TPA: hypothetical protein P5089_02385 [Candidatus Portnoybacteria bacterium]|nr:hypothetical protein [Candidatus Portnoybacteria bacterium]
MFEYFKNLKNQWPVKEEERISVLQLNQIIEREEKLYSAKNNFHNNAYYGKHYSFKDHLHRMNKAKEERDRIYSKINDRRRRALFPFLPEIILAKPRSRRVRMRAEEIRYQDEDNER